MPIAHNDVNPAREGVALPGRSPFEAQRRLWPRGTEEPVRLPGRWSGVTPSDARQGRLLDVEPRGGEYTLRRTLTSDFL
jgi:hypothetical protein